MNSRATVAGEKQAPQLRPVLAGIVETALIVEETQRAADFYRRLLGLEAMFQSDRLSVLDAGPKQVLLLFRRGALLEDLETPGGTIPGGMDATGRSHMAFAIPADQFDAWRRWLERNAIAVESVVKWPRGGKSLYFRDPDGNLLELARPGVWPNY